MSEVQSHYGLPIVIDFRYCAEDFPEANTAQIQALSGQKQQKAKPKWTTRGIIGWVAWVALVVVFFYTMKLNRSVSPRARVRPVPQEPVLTHNFLQTLCLSSAAPAFLIAFFLFVTTKAQYRRRVPFYTPRMPRTTLSQISQQILAAILALAGIAALIAMFQLPIVPDWRPNTMSLFGVLAGPWMVFFVFIVLITRIATKRMQRQQKAGLFDVEGSSRQEPQHIEADESKVAVSTPNVQHVFTWQYFVSYLESENLLMLYTRDLTVQIVPKRAFELPGSFERFCGLVQNHITAGQFLPRVSAFAVLPVQPR